MDVKNTHSVTKTEISVFGRQALDAERRRSPSLADNVLMGPVPFYIFFIFSMARNILVYDCCQLQLIKVGTPYMEVCILHNRFIALAESVPVQFIIQHLQLAYDGGVVCYASVQEHS